MATNRYQIFLSFRGSDTRKGFADHLHTSLGRAGICTYRDCDDLERGEAIDAELEKAIKESRLAIIIFSPDYASSKWCLMELVKILHEKRNTGLKILPVFYHVQPSQVRNQTGSFKTAFDQHEGKNKGTEEEQRKYMEKVDEWRVALKEVADLGGKVLEDENDGYESKFVEEIVEHVRVKLHQDVWNGLACLRLYYYHYYLASLFQFVVAGIFLYFFFTMFRKVGMMMDNDVFSPRSGFRNCVVEFRDLKGKGIKYNGMNLC